MEVQIVEKKIPHFGEQLFGIDTSKPEDTDVYRVKLAFAELAELLKKSYEEHRTPIKSLLFDHAVGEMVSAQMAIVKCITIKKEEDEESTGEKGID